MPANLKLPIGGKVYYARNAPWTINAAPSGFRGNGQIRGPFGHGDQGPQRRALANAAHSSKGTCGLAPFRGVMMPAIAVAVHNKLGFHPDQWKKVLESPCRGRALPVEVAPSRMFESQYME